MGCKINRRKLVIVTSAEMMHTLCPGQPLKNLSKPDYRDFNDSLSRLGKGVYIVGLDFHTGFIVIDGKGNWFVHSDYIEKEGVVKEQVLFSAALRSSCTRWLVSLTGDRGFLCRWLAN